jgi:aminoglycoside 6'-N-acetyltransferase I
MRKEPGVALIAAERGPPIGLVLLHWYRTLEAEQPIAQITTLLVAPTERRRGIGRLLVKAAAQSARVAGRGALELLVAPAEQALHEFCRTNGFTEAGSRFVKPLRKKGQRLRVSNGSALRLRLGRTTKKPANAATRKA